MTPLSQKRISGRHRKTACLAAAMLVCSGITASAACPGNTQLELNDCAAAEFQQADAQLNAVWPQVKGYMDSIGQGLFFWMRNANGSPFATQPAQPKSPHTQAAAYSLWSGILASRASPRRALSICKS